MNITVSIDGRVAEQARHDALAMGKSLNRAVRDHLEHQASRAQLESEIAAFVACAKTARGRLGGWTFDREATHRPA